MANTFKRQLRGRSKLKCPVRYQNFVANISLDLIEPETYKEAIKSDENKNWKEAMNKELVSFHENKTWILEDLPLGKRAIPCKWFFRIKTNANASIDKFKARLVIKGFSQRKGEDYEQSFSPVARTSTIRTLLSVAAKKNMILPQRDVSTAFLYGDLEEVIYMKQPEGYDDGSGRVCRLKRSLYGLKQAPRCWNKKFSSYIISLGFKKSEADPCLFIKKKNSKRSFFALYVDDGLIAADNELGLENCITELKKEFKITSKLASYYLGIEINKKVDGSIRICQTHYTEKVLERFGMSNCKAVATPILKDNDTEKSVPNTIFPYREAVGALMYLMCGTRPDIAHAVGVVSRSLENPAKRDVIKVKRILRYLRGTTDYGINYENNKKAGILECYSDADHCGDIETGRSTTSVLCLFSGAPISLISKRQSSVAISTSEAEVVNEAAIRLAQNPEFHKRTKHIRMRHFFVRELLTAEEINISKVNTEHQLADILTKPLFTVRFRNICKNMNIYKLLNKGEC